MDQDPDDWLEYNLGVSSEQMYSLEDYEEDCRDFEKLRKLLDDEEFNRCRERDIIFSIEMDKEILLLSGEIYLVFSKYF